MIRRPPRSTQSRSSAASDVYKRQNQCHAKAHYAARQISAIPGFALRNQGEFFHEFLTETPCRAETVLAKLAEKDILGGYPVSNGILWCVTEMNSKAQIDALTTALNCLLYTSPSPRD